MIGYLLYIRPFKDENQQTITVINELMIVIVCLFYLGFIYGNLQGNTATNVGWVVVMLVCLQAVSNFVVVIYFGVTKMQRRIRDMFGDDDY